MTRKGRVILADGNTANSPTPVADGKRLLLPHDGSDQASAAVRYVGSMIGRSNTEVVLLHVINPIPDAFWDLGVEPEARAQISRDWRDQQTRSAEKFLDDSRELLLEEGLSPENISVQIRQREKDIATDIAEEARKGYVAVVMGRRGISKIKNLILGSTASKVLDKLTYPSTWIVGGNPRPGKVLVAMDSSAGAMKAVEHVALVGGGLDLEVKLVHIIRGFESEQKKPVPLMDARKWYESAHSRMERVFNEAVERLVAARIPRNRIATQILSGAASRAEMIVRMASEEGYGTIALGRRKISKAEEFLMGRMSNKVIQLARDTGVWVVS